MELINGMEGLEIQESEKKSDHSLATTQDSENNSQKQNEVENSQGNEEMISS
jgi:hypothetical protein